MTAVVFDSRCLSPLLEETSCSFSGAASYNSHHFSSTAPCSPAGDRIGLLFPAERSTFHAPTEVKNTVFVFLEPVEGLWLSYDVITVQSVSDALPQLIQYLEVEVIHKWWSSRVTQTFIGHNSLYKMYWSDGDDQGIVWVPWYFWNLGMRGRPIKVVYKGIVTGPLHHFSPDVSSSSSCLC